jgi:aminopeptidase N
MITTVEAAGTRINLVHYRDRADEETDGTEDAARFAADSIEAFSEVFGPYPYAEMDVAMNPTPSGVEFPGLVQIAARSWTRGEPYLEIVIAHEVGHQWFYSLVGNNQVEHPWIDESLTSYTEVVYLRHIDPTGRRAENHIDSFERDYTRYTGSRQPNLPLDLPVRGYTGFAYGAIVYRKGPLFFVELERQLGGEVVYEALAEYFERFKYEIARSSDIQAVFEDVSGQDLDPVFDEWVFGRD